MTVSLSAAIRGLLQIRRNPFNFDRVSNSTPRIAAERPILTCGNKRGLPSLAFAARRHPIASQYFAEERVRIATGLYALLA
jgi:hypothetical protein